jgi:hypothetical protein
MLTDEEVARLFHEAYERLAPSFGYETNKHTRTFFPLSTNGQLMIATCGIVRRAIEQAAVAAERERWQAEIEKLSDALAVYADPSFYHACSFMFDRPTGGFDEDFDFDSDYDRDMPGKLARDTLRALPTQEK